MRGDLDRQSRAARKDLYEECESPADPSYEISSTIQTPADRLSTQHITECRSATELIDDPARQEIMKLVLRVFLAQGTTNHRALLFAGVDQDTSTPFITAWTGEILADLSRATICLVDANLRSPSLHECFGLKNEKGFAELIQSSHLAYDEFTQRIGPNLWVLTAGNAALNQVRLTAQEAVQATLADLTEQFQFVLICGAPICLAVDAVAIGGCCDGVIMIVETETRKHAALSARQLLDAGGVRLIGAVLNSRRDFPNAPHSRVTTTH